MPTYRWDTTLDSLKSQPLIDDEMFEAGRSLSSFNEYFEEELMKGLSPELASFLAKCSLLDVISPDSAAAIMSSDGGRISSNLQLLRESAIPHNALDRPETFGFTHW